MIIRACPLIAMGLIVVASGRGAKEKGTVAIKKGTFVTYGCT